MPPKHNPELLKLRQDNKAQKKLIDDLRKQIEELLEQIAGLQGQLQESLSGNKELKEQLGQLQDRLDDLLIQISNSKRKDHGPTTERHNPRPAPSQPSTEQDEIAIPDGEVEARLKARALNEKRPRNHKKHINEQNLPVQNVIHSVKPEDIPCPQCLVDRGIMSYIETSQIERMISSLVKLKHRQEVRSCQRCKQSVITAEKPCPPIPGSYAGPHLLTGVIIDKFADALPNYRQSRRFARENATIPRSTQCDWVIASSLTIEPLYELLKKTVLFSKVVQTDDTWVKIQEPELRGKLRKGKMRKGKITSYVGDQHHPLNFFDFSPDLSFERNKAVLKDFKGYVQADAANGFDALFEQDSDRIEVGCNAHSRRKFWQSAQSEAYEVVCSEILDIYRELYKTEKEFRHSSSEERLAARQTTSKAMTDKLHEKLLALKGSLNPTNPLMKAVNYTLNHWDALIRFLDDPDLEIDNNRCERAIKEFVIVRKNALFVGSDAGGKAAAIHLTFISSCARLGINPEEYLADVFTRINSMKVSDLEQLLPHRWAETRRLSIESKPPPEEDPG